MGGQQSDLLQATVLADVGLVLITGTVLLRLCRRVRQPAVMGEILAGIALGPSLLGLLPGHLTEHVFSPEVRPFLSSIAQIGLLLFMFALGWELNTRQLRDSSGSVLGVTVGSIGLPFAAGVAAAQLCYGRHSTADGHPVGFATFAAYLGIAMAITAFPVLARILRDSDLSRTRPGVL